MAMAIEINKQGISFFFGYGPFSITINVLEPLILALDLIKDIYKLGKETWNASFKIFLADKKFVTGVVNAIEDVMKFLFD